MKIKPNFLRKIKVKNKMSSAAIFVWRFKGERETYIGRMLGSK